MRKQAILAGIAVLAMVATTNAGFISGVTKANGNDSYGSAGPPNLDFVVLSEDELARNDRTHKLVEIPPQLTADNDTDLGEIAEMVQLSNSDKDSAGVSHDISLSRLSVLYIGIDNRQFDNGGGMNLQETQYSWMSDTSFTGLPSGFHETGAMVGIDENGNGEANQYFTLFAVIAPPNTPANPAYTLGAHTGGGNNMYIVIADDHLLYVVPEPNGLSLAGFGFLGLAALRRRRRK